MIDLLFRISVTLGLLGMGLGIAMGISQNFTLMPAHAHLNLVGFVTLFLSALYYRAVPEAAASAVARVQAATSVAGAFVFPLGLAGALTFGFEHFEPIVICGAIMVFAGMTLFAFVVYRTSAMAQITERNDRIPHRANAGANSSR